MTPAPAPVPSLPWARWLVAVVAVAVSLVLGAAAPRDRTPPTTPTNLHVTSNNTSTSVSLAWNASTDDSGFWYYQLESNAGPTVALSRAQASYTWPGLTPGRTYWFRIYAIDGSRNQSANSNTVTVTLPTAAQAPSAPVLSVTEVGPTHISFSWTASNGTVPRYWLYEDGATQLVQYGQTTTFTRWFLSPGETHSYVVRARDNTGLWSEFSNSVTVTTPPANPNDHTPPTAPTGLFVDHSPGDQEFRLEWTQSTDDLDPQRVLEYRVFVNGELADLLVGSGGPSTDFMTEETNTVTVVAVDTAGNQSAPASITVHISN